MDYKASPVSSLVPLRRWQSQADPGEHEPRLHGLPAGRDRGRACRDIVFLYSNVEDFHFKVEMNNLADFL